MRPHILNKSIYHLTSFVHILQSKMYLGEIIAEASIKLYDGKSYRVVQRDSSQIQVYNSDTGDKEVARRILGKYIDENNLDIQYNSLNTRSIGKQFFIAVDGQVQEHQLATGIPGEDDAHLDS